MAVRVISASWAKNPLIPTFQRWCKSSSLKIFCSPIRASWWLVDWFQSPEPKDVWFLLCKHDVGRVHEKFSSRRLDEMMAVRVTLASWAQKRLIPSFYTWCTSSWWKIFFSTNPSSWWLLESLRPADPKTFDSFFLYMIYVELMKIFLLAESIELMAVRVISASWAQKRFDSYFLDNMYVEFMKNFLLADSSELMGVRVTSASWAKKRLIPTF